MAYSILSHITSKSISAFNARAVKQDGCWGWTGMVDGAGYARLSLNKNVKVGAHRFSYALHYGIDPADKFVCHRCDNPLCINPDHLFLGTHADNMRDMDAKGRRAPQDGQKNGAAKLTQDQVEDIKTAIAAWMANTEIGNLYGVHHSQISAIKRGLSWHKIGTPVVLSEFSSAVSA